MRVSRSSKEQGHRTMVLSSLLSCSMIAMQASFAACYHSESANALQGFMAPPSHPWSILRAQSTSSPTGRHLRFGIHTNFGMIKSVDVNGKSLKSAFSQKHPGAEEHGSKSMAADEHSGWMEPDKGFDTHVVHGSSMKDQFGSVTFPIYQTSTFRFESADHGAQCFAGANDDFIYTRINNPTVRELEKTIAMLENGFDGIATSSGMGAVNTVYMSFLEAGKHVICHETCYGPSRSMLENQYAKFGVQASFVDTSKIEEVRSAIKDNTVLIFLESPANPTVTVTDISAVAEVARQHDIPVCVDNTFCSPFLQKPLDLGADIVLHSLTKSLNGHADVVAGMIVTKTEKLYKKLRPVMVGLGCCMDPNQAFLVRRGLKTLPLRVKQSQESAWKIAKFLEEHDKIAWIRYPGLASHPQHELCKRMMKGPGNMMSFGLRGGLEDGKRFLDSLKVCVLAVSLGGVETLIQHPASMTHAKLSPEARLAGGVSDDLVRLSVGIEDVRAVRV
uniref:plant cystathionine gamma-synthase n=1 Tax=Guillardia theta TaxID=55529 RepID=A0A7S4UYL2_GUITH|mmetsp:Transcript_52447/g.162779  ORF Transcript_52447/g.162779 Transcript_52447/m.162779 type:complete len:503 (+) Transcript_52447:39-1547(+)